VSDESGDEREERILLSILEGGDRPVEPAAAGGDGETLQRLYTELAGLLPYALDPVAPRPEVKQRLMAAVRAEGREGAGRAAPASPRVGRARGWALALAAGLALALLGTSATLYLRLRTAEQEVARLGQELDQANAHRQQVRARLASLGEKLSMVTAAGAVACPLRPMGEDAPQPAARGVLYIAADHQHWFLKIVGLAPAPAERAYQLWFFTDAGPVSAGLLTLSPGAEAELSSPRMPAGITAVGVTLEPAAGVPRPSGPTVLFGNEKMSLL
jgi:Anti-sigma-K factor rskA, C-terminal